MICEKCGAVINTVMLDMFKYDGSDSDVSHPIEYENEQTGAIVIDTTPNWTGYELTESEMTQCMSCPNCGKFPFKCKEIQVYNIVRVVCFKEISE